MPVKRVKIAYWALISVLGALTFFLVAAGARVLRWRMDREGGASGGDPGERLPRAHGRARRPAAPRGPAGHVTWPPPGA